MPQNCNLLVDTALIRLKSAFTLSLLILLSSSISLFSQPEKESATSTLSPVDQLPVLGEVPQLEPDKSMPFELVFADSTLRSSLSNEAVRQILSPIPVQVNVSGELIPYTGAEWEAMIDLLSSPATYNEDLFYFQFFLPQTSGVKIGDDQPFTYNLVFQPWFVHYLKQQVESGFESFYKTQMVLGNKVIIDVNTGFPTASNIQAGKYSKSSNNPALAYSSLFYRWLAMKPSMYKAALKSKNISTQELLNPLSLCKAFAPQLAPAQPK